MARISVISAWTAVASALLLAVSAQGQTNEAAPQHRGGIADVGRKAGDIASQPARDVGASGTKIPDVLVKAASDPYGLKGIRTCAQISAAVNELNAALGPDYRPGVTTKESRVGKLAEAGGKTVVNTLIPFRGLVREISGAAPAQRRLNAAVDAGFARRGFLRGVHGARGCRTGFVQPQT